MGMQELKEMRQALGRLEATSVPGANPLTPRQHMIDASDIQAKHPDKHIRWVNIKDQQKAMARQTEGYVRLSSEDGGKHLGDELALFAQPIAKYEAKVEQISRTNKERLEAHNHEMERFVGGIAKVLRDNYGIKVDERRLLVRED